MRDAKQAFVVGDCYSNAEIYVALQVGNAGGVRIKTKNRAEVLRAALFTSIPTPRQLAENPYHDRIEGDVLVYTGTGLSGNQHLTGTNARLQGQRSERFPVYGFAQVSSRRSAREDNRRWMFIGLLDLLRSYQEQQSDATSLSRSVWVFEFQVLRRPETIVVEDEIALAAHARALAPQEPREEDGEVVTLNQGLSAVESETRSTKLEPIRRSLLALEPRQFELFLQDLLVRSGFVNVEVTRFSQDGGIDINALVGSNIWPIRKSLLQVQAKRWLHTVGRREVAELRGSLAPHALGCIISTSHFSRAAITESREGGKVPINLIDGHELAQWCLSSGFSVKS